jgi:integrase
MKRRTWTNATIRNLKPRTGQRQSDFSDPAKTGLVVRVSQQSDGTVQRQWRRKHRVQGQNAQRTFSIGAYPDVGLADARAESTRVKESAKAGHDPLEARHEVETARTLAGTFAELVEIVLADAVSPKNRKAYSARSILEMRRSLATVSDRMQNSSCLDITTKDVGAEVIGAYRRSRERGGHGVMANRLVSHISSVYRRAQQLQLVPAGCNPARDVQAPAAEEARDRVLDEGELVKLWTYLCNAEGQSRAGLRLALRLALITAQRIGEVCSARLDHIDLGSRAWTISNTKNGRTHIVPLSDLAVQVIEQAAASSEVDSWGYLFPSTGAKGHLRPDSVNTALTRDRDVVNIENRWTPNDLRRTAATSMGRLGVNRFILSRVLNHTDSSVDGIYDRHDYLSQKRRALILWAAELQRSLSGK